MKLTKEKLKQLIKEEFIRILEEEDTNAMIDDAQKATEQEAIATFNKIKSGAEKAKMDVEMLKAIFIQFLQNME